MLKSLFLLLVTLTLVSFSQQHSSYSFVGTWEGGEKKQPHGFNLIFDKDGYAFMGEDGDIIGGKEFEIEGEKASLSYKIDSTKTPIHLDLTFYSFTTKKSMSIKCIAKFIDSDNLVMAMGENEAIRPAKFEDDYTVYLKRKK